jgi:hypothetical protein
VLNKIGDLALSDSDKATLCAARKWVLEDEARDTVSYVSTGRVRTALALLLAYHLPTRQLQATVVHTLLQAVLGKKATVGTQQAAASESSNRCGCERVSEGVSK